MRSQQPAVPGAIALFDGSRLPLAHARPDRAACCNFSVKDQEVVRPTQKTFVTLDPAAIVHGNTWYWIFRRSAIQVCTALVSQLADEVAGQFLGFALVDVAGDAQL